VNQHEPAPAQGRFFSPGTYFLLGGMVVGYAYGLARFLAGLSTVTNLTDAYPWGLWVAIDVACGVALAAGGFTTAALIEVVGRRKFHALLRPAILTAWLGYIMVGAGLLFDLGRYWNAWRPVFNWQGNSVLFEVGMCVMAYLVVLTVEMSPAFLDALGRRFSAGERFAAPLRWLRRSLYYARRIVLTVMPFFVLAGVVLSCMHQSSLGALMLIAPTKMSPLWYTPILPLLFLLSAIMVGFPMVIVESILISRSLHREIEMDVLAPLARLIPWTLAIYGVVRLTDVYLRRGTIALFEAPGHMIAFLAEMLICLVLPFVLFLLRAVRRSPGWLFFASLLVVAGVVINRINVFLVAYEPPFPGRGYFPAVGEIALTLGLVCTIMFLYRVFVFVFPILSTGAATQDGLEPRLAHPEDRSPAWAWPFRFAAIALILGFSVLYAVVHREAVTGQVEALEWGRTMAPISPEVRQLSPAEHAGRPEGYRKVYELHSRLLNTDANFYEPVRFTHLTHDVASGGNCQICHHRVSMGADDRIGADLEELHLEMDVHLGGSCVSCHDMETLTIQRCDSCHWLPNEADDPSRPGLKGAYHRQCIGCHESLTTTAYTPTDCAGCHHPLTPNHTDLVQAEPGMKANQIATLCADCHLESAEDVLRTAHWNWSGHSPEIFGHEDSGELGLETLVNNYMLGVASNRDYCGTCHIGLGFLTGEAPLAEPAAIDCLVCHDTTGTYRKQLDGGGQPDPAVDLVAVAHSSGRPSRFNCGGCHFYSDGGPNLKQGDLEPILADPPDDFDVHMGRHDMRCQDCHTTLEHRIAGMSVSAPAVEGRVTCVQCHGETPHGISDPLGRHLDNHFRSLACEVCHIPTIAKDQPTRIFIDYSRAETYGAVPTDAMGRPVYPEESEVEIWVDNLVPTYAWYDGSRTAYSLGDRLGRSRPVALNQPLGERRNPVAKIHPFKTHQAIQPYDPESKTLVVADLWDGFWSHFDLGRAIVDGMAAAGLEYSGSYEFVPTIQYSGIHHEVVPATGALGCGDCHEAQAVACQRCHRGISAAESARFGAATYPGETPLDLEALGYAEDPARTGGRFAGTFGPGRPAN